jgi:hypothetical protein
LLLCVTAHCHQCLEAAVNIYSTVTAGTQKPALVLHATNKRQIQVLKKRKCLMKTVLSEFLKSPSGYGENGVEVGGERCLSSFHPDYMANEIRLTQMN